MKPAGGLGMWCYASPCRWSVTAVSLPEDEHHHVHRVMRLGPGDPVHVFDGEGRVGSGRLEPSGSTSSVQLQQVEEQPSPELSNVTLAAAVCKPARWDWMLEKCGELGVGTLKPLLSHRSVARPDKKPDKKHQKWQSRLIAACKQSHNATLPRLSPLQSLSDWLSAPPQGILLTGALTEDAVRLAQALPASIQRTDPLTVVVGPEGDFDETEYQELERAGFKPVDFGPRILRCETAALYVLSALLYEYQRSANHD